MAEPAAAHEFEILKVWLQVAGYVVSWFLVALGWNVTSRHSLAREKRKELRAKIDGFIEAIEAIEQDARKFYTTSAADVQSATSGDIPTTAALQNAIGRLSRGLSRLKKTQQVDATTAVVRFRQAITGGEFASRTRKASSEGSMLLHDISNAALDLIEQLEAEYDRICP